MTEGLKIAFFGSSLVSTYWNGAATYFRGIIRALSDRGHHVTFYEPDFSDRHDYRDLAEPEWANVVFYPEEGLAGVSQAIESACGSDVVIKTSAVGVFDRFLEEAILDLQRPETNVIYWDLNASITFERLQENPHDPLRSFIPRYDLILTAGGGEPVVCTYGELGAKGCVPIYAALDPTVHYPVLPDLRFVADLSFVGNRMADREARVEEFLVQTALAFPQYRFLLAGDGWDEKPLPDNVYYIGHLSSTDHNAFNCTARAILNVCSDSMIDFGFCPTSRMFEAAGAAACVITDAWDGIELFFEPGEEVLVAETGREAAECLRSLTLEQAQKIGKAAHQRALAEHTFAHRAAQLEMILDAKMAGR